MMTEENKQSTRSKLYKDYYAYPIPFDPSIGLDAFQDVEVAPKVKDVDNEFKKNNCYMSNPKIMASGVDFPYTDEQLIEFKKCSENVFYFIINYCKVITLNGGLANLGLYQYQKNAIKLMHENRFTIFKFPRQMGKALHEDTLIKVGYNRYVKLKEIKLGDTVFNENDEPTKVTYKTKKLSNQQCFELVFKHTVKCDYKRVIADKGHLWGVYTKNGEYVVVTTYELYNNTSKYTLLNNDLILEEVNYTAPVPMYCIEIDSPTHLFKITDFDILTHNCVTHDTKIDVAINGEKINMTIGQLYDLIETENMIEEYIPNSEYEIYTEDGYKNFDGITTRYTDTLVHIYYGNDQVIKCTPDHEVKNHEKVYVKAKDLSIGDNIGVNDDQYITKIETHHGEFKVADVIEVEDEHSFAVNDMSAILSNCIDGDTIVTLKDTHTGQIFDVQVKDLYKYLEEEQNAE